MTGTLVRPSVEGGIGYGFGVGDFALSPALRYLQVVQSSAPLSDEDARVLLFGIDFAILDARSGTAGTSTTGGAGREGGAAGR